MLNYQRVHVQTHLNRFSWQKTTQKKHMEKYLKTIYVVARRVSRSHGKGLEIYPLVNVNKKLWKQIHRFYG